MVLSWLRTAHSMWICKLRLATLPALQWKQIWALRTIELPFVSTAFHCSRLNLSKELKVEKAYTCQRPKLKEMLNCSQVRGKLPALVSVFCLATILRLDPPLSIRAMKTEESYSTPFVLSVLCQAILYFAKSLWYMIVSMPNRLRMAHNFQFLSFVKDLASTRAVSSPCIAIAVNLNCRDLGAFVNWFKPRILFIHEPNKAKIMSDFFYHTKVGCKWWTWCRPSLKIMTSIPV